MPFEPGGGGAGGGTVSDICTVSPSDQVGAINNLVSRIEELEKNVSELMSANVSANQLSDLSQQAGWITGVTYLGVEGWTQTPAGTLIPPAGWTGLSTVIDGFQGTMYGGGRNIKTVYYQDLVTDLAAGSDTFVHPNSVSTVEINTGNTELTESSLGGGAKTGWLMPLGNSYIVIAELQAGAGTSAPSSGYVNLGIYAWRQASDVGGYAGFGMGQYPPNAGGGENASSITATAFYTAPSTVDRGWVFRISNNTNGDIRVANLRVSFIKVP